MINNGVKKVKRYGFYTTPEYRHGEYMPYTSYYRLKDLVTEYNIKNKEETGKGRIRWYKNGKLEE